MSNAKPADRHYLIALTLVMSAVLAFVGSVVVEVAGDLVKWSYLPSPSSLVFAALPWVPWIILLLRERGGSVEALGVKATISATTQFYLTSTVSFDRFGELSKEEIGNSGELEARVQAAEYYASSGELMLAFVEESKRPAELHALVELLLRVGNFYHSRASFDAKVEPAGEESARKDLLLGKAHYWYGEAVRLDATNGKAHAHLGCVLSRLHQYEQARKHLDRALELGHSPQLVLFDKALSYSQQSEEYMIRNEQPPIELRKNERRCYLELVKQQPHDAEALYNLSLLSAQLLRSDALEWLQKAIDEDENLVANNVTANPTDEYDGRVWKAYISRVETKATAGNWLQQRLPATLKEAEEYLLSPP